jgi:hypothetical protein
MLFLKILELTYVIFGQSTYLFAFISFIQHNEWLFHLSLFKDRRDWRTDSAFLKLTNLY